MMNLSILYWASEKSGDPPLPQDRHAARRHRDKAFRPGGRQLLQRCRAAWNSEDHQTMQYGDYFFIEAINKLRGETYHMW